jgi:hypothetical protein
LVKLAECDLPRTRAYAESLPQGLDSYPELQVKGSAVVVMLRSLPETIDLDRFPDELRDMLEHPPTVSAWTPEVHFVAFCIAARELMFESDEGFLEWAEEGYKGYFSASFYRILFAVISPQRLARGADKKWGALRRGSRREMTEATEQFNRGRLVFPRNAFPLFYLKILRKGFLVAYRLSRAANAEVRLVDWSTTEASFEIIYDVDSFVPPAAS